MTNDPAITYNVPVFDRFQDYIDSEAVTVVKGYTLVEKDSLVGVPFIVRVATFRPGSYGEAAYVSCECLTVDNNQVVFNDGSTGVRAQIIEYCEAKGIFTSDDGWFPPAEVTLDEETGKPTIMVPMALLARNGLRVSHYDWTDPKDGIKKPATTYYLA